MEKPGHYGKLDRIQHGGSRPRERGCDRNKRKRLRSSKANRSRGHCVGRKAFRVRRGRWNGRESVPRMLSQVKMQQRDVGPVSLFVFKGQNICIAARIANLRDIAENSAR